MFSHIFPIKCLHLKSTCSLMCINFPPEYKLHVLQGRGKTEIERTSVVVTTDSKQWYAQYLRKESMLEKGKHRCSLITLLKIFFSEKKMFFMFVLFLINAFATIAIWTIGGDCCSTGYVLFVIYLFDYFPPYSQTQRKCY